MSRKSSYFFSGLNQWLLGTAFFALTALGVVRADVREVSGEFFYGPETSESKACEAAEQKAKQEALRQVLGERFSISEQLSCREGKAVTDNTDCVYNTFLWSEIDGDIKKAQRVSGPFVFETIGAKRCVVKMKVEVVKPALLADPGFDLQVRLNAIRLKSGDDLSFLITPSAPMHLTIFAWAPSSNKDVVTRVFPNAFDPDGYMALPEATPVPSKAGGRNYSFQASFPVGLKQDYVDEYLIFVATKRPVAWLESYDFEQFRARIREISPPDKRVVKRSYRIIN